MTEERKIQLAAEVDATGAKAGFDQIKAGAKDMAQSVGQAGQAAGKAIDGIGSGGAASAAKVDRDTQSMIGSIQRTTAAMEAGSKTGAKYYEVLAAQRGVNVEALRPYLAQLEQANALHGKATGSALTLGGALDNVKASAIGFGTALVGGLVAAASIAGFKSLIVNTIESTAKLHDLAIQTGATVEALSGLASIGKYSNVGVEDIAASMNKLAKNMAGASEESKGTGKALEALGINFEKFRQLSPDQQFQDIARSLDGFQDGAGKGAASMALFGKEGAKLLPLFKDLAVAGDLQAKVTTEQASMADDFSDNLLRLRTSGEAWKKQLALGMLPALNDFANAFIETQNSAAGLKGQIASLSKDGTFEDWTRAGINGLTRVIDVLQVAWKLVGVVGTAFKNVGLDIADFATTAYRAIEQFKSGNFSKATDGIVAGFDKMGKRSESFKAQLDDLWSGPLKGQQLREQMLNTQIRRMGDLGLAADATKPKLDFTNVLDKSGKAAKEAVDEYQKLLDRIIGKEVGVEPDFIQNLRLLAVEGAKRNVPLAETIRLQEEYIKQQPYMKAQAKIQEEEAKARASVWAETLKQAEAYEKSVASIGLANDKMREELDLLGLTATQQAAYQVAKNETTIALKEEQLARIKGTETMSREQIALEEEIRLLRERNQLTGAKAIKQSQIDDTKAAVENFKDIWQSVDRTAHDVFVNIFDGGKNAFTKLRDVLKATVLDLLYQMTVKKWIISIAASVTGAAPSIVSAATGGAGGLTNLGGLAGGAGAFSSGLGAGFSALLGESGIGGALSAGATSIGAGSLAAGFGTIVGALGPIALGIGALVSLTKGKGGPKEEAGYSPNGLSIAGRDVGGNMQGSERGDVGAAKQYSDTVAAAYKTLADSLGLAKKALDVGIFFSKDTKGDSLTQLQVTSSAGYDRGARLGGIENVGRGENDLQNAITEETSRVLLQALKASDIGEQYKEILNGLTADAGSAEIQKTIERITAARTQQLSLEEQLFQLTADDAAKMARAREKERAAVDPLNAALLESVYAQQDLATATQKATAAAEAEAQRVRAVANERAGLERQIMQLLGDTAGLRRLELAALDETNRPLQERIYALQDEAERARTVTAAQVGLIDSTNEYIDAMQREQEGRKSANDGINEFIRSLKNDRLGTATPEAMLAANRSSYLTDLSRARGGDWEAAGRLPASAQAYLEAQRAYTASGATTQAVINQVISELTSVSSDSRSYDSQMLASTATIVTRLEALQVTMQQQVAITSATAAQSLELQQATAANTGALVQSGNLAAAEAPL